MGLSTRWILSITFSLTILLVLYICLQGDSLSPPSAALVQRRLPSPPDPGPLHGPQPRGAPAPDLTATGEASGVANRPTASSAVAPLRLPDDVVDNATNASLGGNLRNDVGSVESAVSARMEPPQSPATLPRKPMDASLESHDAPSETGPPALRPLVPSDGGPTEAASQDGDNKGPSAFSVMDQLVAAHGRPSGTSEPDIPGPTLAARGGRNVPRKTLLRSQPRAQRLALPPRTDARNASGRYLFVCPNYGRTNNQMVSLAKAYTLAYYSRRTLVMTRWWHKNSGTDKKRSSVDRYFNFTGGPVPIISRVHFGTLAEAWPGSLCAGTDRLDTCLFGERVVCARTTRMSEHAPAVNVQLLSGPQAVVALDGHNSFFANVPHWPCIWSYARIPLEFSTEVDRWTAAAGLPTGFLALHMRFMENKCVRFAKKHVEGFRLLGMPSPDLVTDLAPMCTMDKGYYSRWRNRSHARFYVAHDFQFDRATMTRLTNDGATYYYGGIGGDERLIIDFWLCVEAGIFLGNAMSTMSLNVCSIRRALGKTCANLDYIFKLYPCHPHPDFDKGFTPALPGD